MTEPFFDHERLDVLSNREITKRCGTPCSGSVAASCTIHSAQHRRGQRETKSQGQESIFRDRARLSFGMRCDSRYTRIIRSDRSSTSTSTAMLSTSTRKRTNKALDRSARSARSDMVTFSPRTRSMRLTVADTQAFFSFQGFKKCN
jgi:hypothetical protein